VLRVALRIIVHYDVHDADIICGALLHDSVEGHADDMSPAGRPGAFTVLTACFGPRVANLVGAVTNPIYAQEIDEDDQYRAHVVTSLENHPWARVLKASDFTDYADLWIMPSSVRSASLRRRAAGRCRHNQRVSRKARMVSGGAVGAEGCTEGWVRSRVLSEVDQAEIKY
jgi:hypothetical protein